MVYNDFELIPSKRVNALRQFGFSPYKRRFFDAMGGFNTIYLATFCGLAAKTFNMTSSVALVKPVMSASGVRSFTRNVFTAGGPALLGVAFGVSMFGSPSEVKNLFRNMRTYSREMHQVDMEQYY